LLPPIKKSQIRKHSDDLQSQLSRQLSLLKATDNDRVLMFESKYIQTDAYQTSRELLVNIPDFEGVTPLHLAAIKDNYRGAKFLLEIGACPFLRDSKQRKPSDYAKDSVFTLIFGKEKEMMEDFDKREGEKQKAEKVVCE